MREPGRYLIINPGRPDRRELKKAPRRKPTTKRRKNPQNDDLIAVLEFAKEKLKNHRISDSGRRQIRRCLIDINDVFAKES